MYTNNIKKTLIESIIPLLELIFFALYEDNYNFFLFISFFYFYSLFSIRFTDFSCENQLCMVRCWTLRNRNDLYSDNERQLQWKRMFKILLRNLFLVSVNMLYLDRSLALIYVQYMDMDRNYEEFYKLTDITICLILCNVHDWLICLLLTKFYLQNCIFLCCLFEYYVTRLLRSLNCLKLIQTN